MHQYCVHLGTETIFKIFYIGNLFIAEASWTVFKGGIWRIRQPRNKTHKNIIGLACMHNGFQVLDVKEDDCKIEKLGQYNQHQSLAYGLDFQSKTSENQLQLASCSFYDSLLNVWNLKLDT